MMRLKQFVHDPTTQHSLMLSDDAYTIHNNRAEPDNEKINARRGDHQSRSRFDVSKSYVCDDESHRALHAEINRNAFPNLSGFWSAGCDSKARFRLQSDDR